MEVISQREATARGLLHYFTGKPCKKGHIDKRLCSSFACMECSRIKSRAETPKRQAIKAETIAQRKVEDPRIITRSEARDRGAKRYFTGDPCSRGHVCERYVASKNCTQCVLDNARTPEHRAKVRLYVAANKGKASAWAANYREKNIERYREMHRRKRMVHGAKYAAYKALWRLENQASIRAHTVNRRARKLAAGGTFRKRDIERIFAAQKGRCAACSACIKRSWQIDHIVPLARGGHNWPANLQLLCGPCNRRKSAKDPIDFMRSLGRLL